MPPAILTTLLVNAYNYATAPNILRTDDEHARYRKLSRAIKARLNKKGNAYHETESGRLAEGRSNDPRDFTH